MPYILNGQSATPYINGSIATVKLDGSTVYQPGPNFDGDRRITEAEYNALMEEFKKSAIDKEKLDEIVEIEQE